jgi:hypothetical protein
MEEWWNDTDRETPKYWEKYFSQCYFIHHKSHMDWPVSKPEPPR